VRFGGERTLGRVDGKIIKMERVVGEDGWMDVRRKEEGQQG